MATRKYLEKKIRFIDLFAWIGGFHLALHNLGGECVLAAEWDKEARKTYEHNHSKFSKKLFESWNFVWDVTAINEIDVPDFDILCAGFPCQPFSQAWFKKGFWETRWTLFFDIVRILKEKKPEAFFLENVRHLLKHDEGKTFATIQRVIREELGYSFFYKIVKASDFWLPQHRPRLFMVWFKDKSIDFQFPDPVDLQTSMSDIWEWECSRKVGFTLRVGWKWTNISDRRNWDSYLVDGMVKRLTSKQGKEMQWFPQDFEFPVSENQAMKQLWNSVAVPAIQAVAESIIKHLKNVKGE